MSHIDEKDIEIENDTELQNEVQNNDEPIEIVVEEEKNESPKFDKDKKEKKVHFKWLRGAFSELKKVTWPSFGRVVKETIVVLSVTAVFLIVIFGIDQLLNQLYNLLTGSMGGK